MEWAQPYTTTYICEVLDPADGMPVGTLEIRACSVSLADEGVGMTATMDMLDPVLDYPVVRISARAEQDGEVATVPLFTGKAHCTGRKWDVDVTYETEGEGLLGMADAKAFPIGRAIPAKSPRGEAAATILREVLPPWVLVSVEDGSPQLADPMNPEDGDTYLSMAEKLLKDCNWRMRRLGDGNIEICAPGEPVAHIDIKDDDVLLPDITDQRDEYESVSVLQVITSDGGSVTVRDEGLISRVGFERWEVERDVSLSSEQTLDGYARERMASLNDSEREVAWTREYIPQVCCSDVIECEVVCCGVEGNFRSRSMDIRCEEGILVDETVVENG